MNKLELLKISLETIISSIDSGNSNISDEQCDEVLSLLNKVINPESKYSKYQACEYLGLSRATFDNLVREGIIPRGRKQQGFKELFYLKKDLDDAKNKINRR